MQTLLLNAYSVPVGIIPWQRAVLLLLDGRVELIDAYPDRRVRSASDSLPWPAVVRDNTRLWNLSLAPNRQNVLARDRYQCLYCGVEPRTAGGRPNVDALTVDHVIPQCRAFYGHVETRAGALIEVGCWENLATACGRCNGAKGGRTPQEAGMSLLRQPTAPGLLTRVRIVVSRVRTVPIPWERYLIL